MTHVYIDRFIYISMQITIYESMFIFMQTPFYNFFQVMLHNKVEERTYL